MLPLKTHQAVRKRTWSHDVPQSAQSKAVQGGQVEGWSDGSLALSPVQHSIGDLLWVKGAHDLIICWQCLSYPCVFKRLSGEDKNLQLPWMALGLVMGKVGAEDAVRTNDWPISGGNLHDRDKATQYPERGHNGVTQSQDISCIQI